MKKVREWQKLNRLNKLWLHACKISNKSTTSELIKTKWLILAAVEKNGDSQIEVLSRALYKKINEIEESGKAVKADRDFDRLSLI